MRLSFWVVGVIVLVVGLHWIGQGTGYFAWPHNPVMDNHIEWAYFGIAATIAGLVILVYAWLRAR
jgi:hypothetical protein